MTWTRRAGVLALGALAGVAMWPSSSWARVAGDLPPVEGGGGGGICSSSSSGTPYTWTLSVNATRIPLPGTTTPVPTSNIEFQLRCSSTVHWTDGSTGSGGSYTIEQVKASCMTGANGACTYSASVRPDRYDAYPNSSNPAVCDTYTETVNSCTLVNATEDRKVDWSQTATTVTATTDSMGTMSGAGLRQNRTWNNTVENAAPLPDVIWSDPSPHNNYNYTGINYKSRTTWGENGWTTTYKGASAMLWKSFDGVYDKPIVVIDGWDPDNGRTAFDLYNKGLVWMWNAVGVDVWIFDPAEGAESLRAHIDDLAWALKQIAEYGDLNRIDMVIGISAGGIEGRAALAALEHVKNGGTAPSWFTYATDPYNGAANRAYGNRTAGFLSWDSPFEGAAGIPRSSFLIFRKFMTLSKNDLINICNPKGKFWLRGFGRFLGSLVANTLGNMLPIPGAGPALAIGFNMAVVKMNKSIAERARAISKNVYNIAAPVVDAGSTKDLLLDWCSSNSASSCNGTNHNTFRNEMAQFNGTGRPTQTKLMAFSQGSWAPLRCLWPDQWGKRTCSGPAGYYPVDERDNGETYAWRTKYRSAALSSPNHVGVIPSGAKFAQIDLFDSRCRNDPSMYVTAKDVVPGSVSTVLNSYVEDINDSMAGEAAMNVYFASTFVGITSSLNMTSATSTSPNKDVQWAPYADRHEAVHYVNFMFMNKLVYEFTTGDKDGTVTCSAASGNWVFPPGRVGRFCDCDPDDQSASVSGTCGATPTCTVTTTCSGQCGRVADNCGGYIECGACPVCGDGVCNGTEDAWSCQDCTVCGDSICSPQETCAQDCGTSCGDYICDLGEDPFSCPQDCSSSCNYNYWCESWIGETYWNCPSDC